ncbi:capsule assembly Wzi family protein [Dyadobacter sp. 676]|uniref:Capsule assembly Wzi family protein n=1 Tax=Dyadobacter sp. 676 TaxID=3088362 RepID=A0AAU8FRG2_9BACT
MRKILYVLLLSAALCAESHSQDSTFFYSAGINAAGSTSGVPLWLHANQNASMPEKGSFVQGAASFHRIYNRNNPRFFQWSGGAELVGYAGKKSDVFFTDLFIAGKAGPVELSVGQRKDFMGLGDSLLTMGAIAMSSNYRPYPKIQLSTPNFVNLIPGNDLISFKFSYGDGMLGSGGIHYGNVSSVPDIYLHQKSLYIKLGKHAHRLNLFAGFNHQAMWGGEEKIFTGGLKASKAYEYVVFGKPWKASRVGNHFGTIDVAAEWKGKQWDIFLYRQTIYEDGSLKNLSTISDGLSGLRFKRKNKNSAYPGFRFNTLLFEFLYTKNQGGAVFDYLAGIFGKDNYFNHYVYNQGWSYRGKGLGTPMIPSQNITRDKLFTSETLFTANNMIIAWHLGAEASWKKLNFLLKGSFSQNSGTYDDPINPSVNQTSLLFRIDTPLFGKSSDLFGLSLASDFGQLYTQNMAVMISWRKSGFIW